jgi:hypothetical protein
MPRVRGGERAEQVCAYVVQHLHTMGAPCEPCGLQPQRFLRRRRSLCLLRHPKLRRLLRPSMRWARVSRTNWMAPGCSCCTHLHARSAVRFLRASSSFSLAVTLLLSSVTLLRVHLTGCRSGGHFGGLSLSSRLCLQGLKSKFAHRRLPACCTTRTSCCCRGRSSSRRSRRSQCLSFLHCRPSVQQHGRTRRARFHLYSTQ